jgi:hypothetical protein
MTAAYELSRYSEVRTFKNTQHAVLWFMAKRQKRLLRAAPLEAGTSRAPQAVIDQQDATLAVLIRVMESAQDPADVDPDFQLGFSRVQDLNSWYLDHGALEERLGLSQYELTRYCRHTESIIRRRLEAREMLA